MNLFEGFPREFGSPKTGSMRQIAYNWADLLTYINTYNGTNDVFVSAYRFSTIIKNKKGYPQPDYKTAIVDKIFIDLDGCRKAERSNKRTGKKTGEPKNPKRAHDDAQRIHAWALEHDYLHLIHFSGKCYQIFIFIEQNLKNPQIAMKNFLKVLERKLHVYIDRQLRGRLEQLVRYPDTWHPKGRRFCISVPNFSKMTHLQIMNMAKKQRHCLNFYGSKKIDISEWDRPIQMDEPRLEPVKWDPKFAEQVENIVRIFKAYEIPLCMQRLMTVPNLGYEGRYLLITYLHEMMIPVEATEQILKSFLSPKKYRHCVHEEAFAYGGQPRYIYSRADENGGDGYYMWSCAKMRDYGYCVRGCRRSHPIYE
jgi:hypothetical protein